MQPEPGISKPGMPSMRCRVPPGSTGSRHHEPVTCGVPWPRGLLTDLSCLVLRNEQREERPLQARSLEQWPDGSVRWALLDWLASADGEAGYSLELDDRAASRRAPVESNLQARRAGDRVTVDTGRAQFTLAPGTRFPFAEIEVGGSAPIDPSGSSFVVENASGRSLLGEVTAVRLEETGPVRAAVRLEGRLRDEGAKPPTALCCYLHFFVDSATVRVELTLTNPRAASHPGGIWTLGRRGSIYLRDAALRLALPAAQGAPALSISTQPGAPLEPAAGPLSLYQDSSGGENWRSAAHVNRHGEVPLRFRGFRLTTSGSTRRGERATPIVTVDSGERHLAIAVRHFWQEFPKALEASDDGLVLRLFPRDSIDVHELQGGEQKTHVFHLSCARDAVSDPPLDWCRAPILPHVDPAWYARAEAVTHLVPESSDPHVGYIALVNAAIDGPDAFSRKREEVDEYGWRHFGDLYADHETAHHDEPTPLISHYNNQYDAILGFAIQFFRSGEPRWFDAMQELARHVADIDIYHTEEDRAAYNGGLFWHTCHYTDAGTSSHRSYPPAPGVAGGGPSPEHLYTTGLMLHHYLTGDPRSRDAALQLARYAIDADDGNKTALRWLDRGPTGLSSASGSPDYHGPGRGPGNVINSMVDAYRLSGERRYLDKAEELIRRCVHPGDDVEARDLLDRERRWFYTVFLRSLGNYLDLKADLREFDANYAYARGSLLRYAGWAAEHEYPYLDRPELLEFPTETWAAQELRKSEVFNLASRLSTGAERQHYLDSAARFFDYAIGTLAGMPTRTRCRPLVILMGCGYSQAHFTAGLATSLPHGPEALDFGRPLDFVPQKIRAKGKLVVLSGFLGAALAAWLVWFLGLVGP